MRTKCHDAIALVLLPIDPTAAAPRPRRRAEAGGPDGRLGHASRPVRIPPGHSMAPRQAVSTHRRRHTPRPLLPAGGLAIHRGYAALLTSSYTTSGHGPEGQPVDD